MIQNQYHFRSKIGTKTWGPKKLLYQNLAKKGQMFPRQLFYGQMSPGQLCPVNPHHAVISESLNLREGELDHRRSAVSTIFLHTKQHKRFQGTLGTQDLTSIVPLKWISICLSLFQAVFTISTFYIIQPLLKILVLVELYQGSWDPPGPQMDPVRLISGDLS